MMKQICKTRELFKNQQQLELSFKLMGEKKTMNIHDGPNRDYIRWYGLMLPVSKLHC